MRQFLPALVLTFVLPIGVHAEVAPVAIRVPDATAWTGQRLPFFVELRARGSFAGATSFTLPEIPRTVILKMGSPLVSSEEIEGESWFVQTHEFALFSQQSGAVEIPEFEVSFGSRDGFTGPVDEQRRAVPATRVEIRRPPGSADLGFLITTEVLDITETWDPRPAAVEVGAVFERTIVQRAQQLMGMALAAPPERAPDGVRVYTGQPEVTDTTERGEFLGERRDTVTYLMQDAGTHELPAITYVWWNPETEELRSKTLPAVTFEVTAPPVAASEGASAGRVAWPWLAVAALVVGLGAWQWRRFVAWLRRGWQVLNPPEAVAARALRRACRRHDAVAAQTAWDRWRTTQDARFRPGPELDAAVLGLQRFLFGPSPSGRWRGDDLARAFEAGRGRGRSAGAARRADVLPRLNP